MMRFKYIYKNGNHDFTPCCEHTLSGAVVFASRVSAFFEDIKQIDIYDDSKLIASIYG